MIKLVSNNDNPKDNNYEKTPIYTKKRIIDWMRQGQVCIMRDSPDGFFYLKFHDGRIDPINQELGDQIVADFRVIREDHREGWVETRLSGKTRWVIFWD